MRNPCILIIVCMALFIPALAQAATCNISINGGFAFGNYDPYNGAPTDTTAANLIALTCNGNGNATIDLSPGGSGGYFSRAMSNGTDVLTYNLYTNASLTSVWGDGTGGTSDVTQPYHGNTSVSLSVYGRIPAGQNVNPSSYSDTITVTVSF